jgi:hypothetical protein
MAIQIHHHDSTARECHEPLTNLLSPEGPTVTVLPIDYTKSPLADNYSSFFAMTIDNLLTPNECAKLQGAAGDDWKP